MIVRQPTPETAPETVHKKVDNIPNRYRNPETTDLKAHRRSRWGIFIRNEKEVAFHQQTIFCHSILGQIDRRLNFTPLGMTHSGYVPAEELTPPAAEDCCSA